MEDQKLIFFHPNQRRENNYTWHKKAFRQDSPPLRMTLKNCASVLTKKWCAMRKLHFTHESLENPCKAQDWMTAIFWSLIEA